MLSQKSTNLVQRPIKDRKLLNVLREAGLSEKEALVYFASLSLGPATVLQLSRESGVKRSTLYAIIDGLKAKRLMRREVHGVREVLVGEPAESLKSLLEAKHKALSEALPELYAIQSLGGAQSVIKYYEGLPAVEAVYLNLIQSVKIGEDYLILSDIALWHELDREFFDAFVEKRGRLDIKVRMILTHSNRAYERKGRARKPNECTKILPAQTSLTTNLVIIPSKVFVHQLVAPIMGMVIENQHIIRMHREMYELIWAALPD